MMFKKTKYDGFTLLEILLVMVIVSSIILMLVTYTTTKTDESKRDSMVIQYEQILNAGLAYYINNSAWPTSIDDLKTDKYLPNKTIVNAWGQSYTFYNNTTSGTFSICSTVKGRTIGSGATAVYTAARESGIIAGRLPMAYVAGSCTGTIPDPATCTSNTCAVISTVNIPGQNLNNARSMNFAGLYHNGACVPAPVCPNPYDPADNPTGMKPTIMVVPVSVSGNYYGGNEVYPLSSFTAYAVGNVSGNGDPASQPGKCTASASSDFCDSTSGGDKGLTSGTYWRVCLEVVTERGKIYQQTSGATPWSVWDSNSGTIMAITRCVPNNEPSGSGFNVFQKY